MNSNHQDLQTSFQGAAASFESASLDVRNAQFSTLKSILKRNEASLFGVKHRFDTIDSVEGFQELVPLSEYDDYAEWLSRHNDSNAGVLTEEEVFCFVETSGTTSGKKKIPYTQSLLQDFQQGIAPWLNDIYRHFPEVAKGAWYWSISPPVAAKNELGSIPVGLPSDLVYFSQDQAMNLASILITPAAAKKADLEAFFAETARELAKREDLSFVSVWSPTFLSALANHGDFYPALISCWGDGHSKYYVDALRKQFPHSAIQPKGLISTEAFCSFPMVSVKGHVLSVNSHFFEFIDSHQRVRTAQELEIGEEYEVVVTTSGGLYRYRTHDIIKVLGHYHELPALEFLRRDQTSDLVGEKLSEEDVLRAQSSLEGVCSFVAPSHSEKRYRVFLDCKVSEDQKFQFARELKKNPYFSLALDTCQLHPIEWRKTNGFNLTSEYLNCRQKLGARLGDIKPPLLEKEAVGDYFLALSSPF